VVNGGFPKTRYFSDSLCSVLVLLEVIQGVLFSCFGLFVIYLLLVVLFVIICCCCCWQWHLEGVEIPEHAKTKIESSVCKCEKFMSCSKGTKFEKYYCDSNGGIIAQGFEDSRCLTPSGTNVSMTSS
jgi:hypothetical protein